MLREDDGVEPRLTDLPGPPGTGDSLRCVDETSSHWDGVYSSKPPTTVSWYEDHPATSLRLVTSAVPPDGAVIDVGAGASTLPDALLDQGYSDVTVLDVSAEALDLVKARLSQRTGVSFVLANLLAWEPHRAYQCWHDRAVFHFLTDEKDQRQYVATAATAVAPGGRLVLGVFAEDGPTQCSGLPTARHAADNLADHFADHFVPRHAEREQHNTPSGAVQPLTWLVLERL